MPKLIDIFCERRGITTDYMAEINSSACGTLMDIDEAADFLRDACKSRQRLVVIPDFDMDGIMSGVVGYAGFSELCFNTALFIPNPSMGYGLSVAEADRLMREYPDTKYAVTCDVGISEYDGIARLKDYGVKVLNELGNMLAKDREAYEKFFEEFGVNLKFGVYNNYGMDKEKFQDLLLFYSSREKKYVTLSEYVSRMKEDQKDIYFVSGKDVELIDKMPVVQTLKNKEFEVLYLTDEVDEFVMQTLMNYKEKTFRNAAQGDLDLDSEEEKEALNKSKEENKDLLTFMKEALGDEVAEVKLSNKLTEDPVCLTAGEGISFDLD